MQDIQFKKNYSGLIQPGYGISSPASPVKKQQEAQSSEFAELFRQKLQKSGTLNFSKHALQRLESRSIPVSDQLVAQISSAVEQARAKGVRDALILDGNNAFIVNVPSNTVITTMSGSEMASNVFTNIDGAVVL